MIEGIPKGLDASLWVLNFSRFMSKGTLSHELHGSRQFYLCHKFSMWLTVKFSLEQLLVSSSAQSCLTLCIPMDSSP